MVNGSRHAGSTETSSSSFPARRLRSPASLCSDLLVVMGGHLIWAYRLQVPAIPLSTKRLQLILLGRRHMQRARGGNCHGVPNGD